jgi:hypothetical protein
MTSYAKKAMRTSLGDLYIPLTHTPLRLLVYSSTLYHGMVLPKVNIRHEASKSFSWGVL